MRFKGKVCLVTGSSRGIGRATVIAFAQEGGSVIINYTKNAEAAQKVVEDIKALGQRAIAIQADVSKATDVQNLVEKSIAEFGKLDVLVNCAGIVYDIENWSETTDNQWQETLDVHVMGNFYCAKYTTPHLQKTKGSIVNILNQWLH